MLKMKENRKLSNRKKEMKKDEQSTQSQKSILRKWRKLSCKPLDTMQLKIKFDVISNESLPYLLCKNMQEVEINKYFRKKQEKQPKYMQIERDLKKIQRKQRKTVMNESCQNLQLKKIRNKMNFQKQRRKINYSILKTNTIIQAASNQLIHEQENMISNFF